MTTCHDGIRVAWQTWSSCFLEPPVLRDDGDGTILKWFGIHPQSKTCTTCLRAPLLSYHWTAWDCLTGMSRKWRPWTVCFKKRRTFKGICPSGILFMSKTWRPCWKMPRHWRRWTCGIGTLIELPPWMPCCMELIPWPPKFVLGVAICRRNNKSMSLRHGTWCVVRGRRGMPIVGPCPTAVKPNRHRVLPVGLLLKSSMVLVPNPHVPCGLEIPNSIMPFWACWVVLWFYPADCYWYSIIFHGCFSKMLVRNGIIGTANNDHPQPQHESEQVVDNHHHPMPIIPTTRTILWTSTMSFWDWI